MAMVQLDCCLVFVSLFLPGTSRRLLRLLPLSHALSAFLEVLLCVLSWSALSIREPCEPERSSVGSAIPVVEQVVWSQRCLVVVLLLLPGTSRRQPRLLPEETRGQLIQSPVQMNHLRLSSSPSLGPTRAHQVSRVQAQTPQPGGGALTWGPSVGGAIGADGRVRAARNSSTATCSRAAAAVAAAEAAADRGLGCAAPVFKQAHAEEPGARRAQPQKHVPITAS